jgi:hypothetical protein
VGEAGYGGGGWERKGMVSESLRGRGWWGRTEGVVGPGEEGPGVG